MGIKTLFEEVIRNEIEELQDMEVGTDEHKTAIDCVVKMTDRYIELDKMDNEFREKEQDREIEKDFKQKEMDEERKDRLIKNCLTAASIVTGVGLTVWGTLKTLKFEEEGTVTTIMGRGFINKLLPKK
jgi:hypothetical protein